MAERVVVIDVKGARAASLAENRQRLDADQQAALGEDLVLSQQTPQSQWSGITALALTEIGEGTVRAAQDGSSVDHAVGISLDAHGSLLDIRRRQATYSKVTATLTGESGTNVPAGSRARTEAGAVFETLADVVLSSGGVTVDMQAVDKGAVVAPAGTLVHIVTVIAGWETITNPADAVVGRPRQTDVEYHRTYSTRTAHSSVGPIPALEGALEEALAGKQRVEHNPDDTHETVQEWDIGPHAIVVIAQSGSDGDIRRAVENHRGMGCGTIVAIRGGTPNNTMLDSVSSGSILWSGSQYDGLDLSSASTGALKAAALTTLLSGATATPIVRYVAERYFAFFRWHPNRTPTFADIASSSVAAHFGLVAAAADYPAGPFVRPRTRALAVSFTLTRRPGFPADGLEEARRRVLARVNGASDQDIEEDRPWAAETGYEIGEEVWANDLLCEAERVAGTRITLMSVQSDGADMSGVAVPLDQIWSLAVANLTITVA